MADLRGEIARLTAQVAALTARVYQLEQKSGGVQPQPQQQPQAEAPAEAARPAAVAPPAGTMLQPPAAQGVPGSAPSLQPPPASPPQYHAPSQPTFRSVSTKGDPDLEKKIGQYWLNRVGIVAILIGVSYFLKLAFENDWIGPAGRIAIGLLAGIGFVLWSERFRARGYAAFSYSLKAVGIGTLYLSLWGAFQIYHLIPATAAFVAMIVVTASTIVLALSQNAELLASFALIGGFATPVLLSTGQNHEAVLFSYVCLLDAGILEMTAAKPWRRLLWGSFAGTMILYWGWYADYYSQDQRTLTVFFAALFAAIFAAIPLMTRYARSTRFGGPSITLTLLPLLNAAAFFLALYEMYQDQTATLTWFALALAAVYLGLANAFAKRHTAEDATVIQLLHVAIAIAFITIAVPLKLDREWITIGWLIESAVLLFVSVKTRTSFLRYLAATALVLGIARLLFFDRYNTETLIFNARFATYAVAIAVLGGIAVFGKRHASENEQPLLRIAAVGANLLALIALTLEASDYFDRMMFGGGGYNYHVYHDVSLERGFTYSAIWLIYGAILMAVGFRNRSAFVRWQALILIAFTTGKIFIYDVSQLGGGYRIVSFIALGIVLLGISFVYQRDWLKLSKRTPDKTAQGAS
ncbi:MAG TPA: DUF2339 domain-containing protein [Candidatus Acidoferrales bacterium]|nr:DUF2339 domain-containing protein [Candidatus Acidoferrales bacterium]